MVSLDGIGNDHRLALHPLGDDLAFVDQPVSLRPAEAAFFRDVVCGVVREQRKLDPLIDAALEQSWPLKRIEAILRAVLRAGAYELDHRRDVPARVVVSEYVDVANAFVERDETGMANAVLEQLARNLRASEFDRPRA